MNPFLSSTLSRLLLDRQGGHRTKVLIAADKLRAADRLSREFLQSQQRTALAALLNHARATVPAWKDRFHFTGEISAANAREVLQRFPVMNKRDLAAAPSEYISSSATDAVDNATGGSTGIPLKFKVDRMRQIAGEAAHIWANSMSGWQYGERVAMLWGSDMDVREALADARHALRCWIENVRWYNAFDMGADRMAEYHRAMLHFRPHVIVAYAGAAFAYASFLKSRKVIPAYPLKSIIASAEVLAPDMRRTIESVFGKPVYDRYGSREFGPVAAECPAHAGMHINEMDCVLEVQSDDPCNEPGPILITYLRNYAMPFIRYDTGDLGVLLPDGDCVCGRRTQRLARVIGRRSDMITTASGRQIHGEWFTHLMYGVEGVRQFQLIQEGLRKYRLVLVADWNRTHLHEEGLRTKILEAVGADNELHFEYLQHIHPMPSGKYRFTLSLVREEERRPETAD
ncbi:MAG: phenylacetate--CoA ligase family protein [Kiritimatiellia bacterium]